MIGTVRMAHVAPPPAGGVGRSVVTITLSGGDVAMRQALGDRVIAAAHAALGSTPPLNRLAAVFARISQPPPDPRPPPETLAGAVLPAEAPPAPVPPTSPASPYEAPFLLAPLRRRGA